MAKRLLNQPLFHQVSLESHCIPPVMKTWIKSVNFCEMPLVPSRRRVEPRTQNVLAFMSAAFVPRILLKSEIVLSTMVVPAVLAFSLSRSWISGNPSRYSESSSSSGELWVSSDAAHQGKYNMKQYQQSAAVKMIRGVCMAVVESAVVDLRRFWRNRACRRQRLDSGEDIHVLTCSSTEGDMLVPSLPTAISRRSMSAASVIKV